MNQQCGCCEPFIKRYIPAGDTHTRAVCSKCDTIFYDNPKIITGVIPMYEEKILLCKRAIEPQKNLWTVPSGFMEKNETLQQAALREANEEAGITPEIECLHTIYDLAHIGQVYFLFLAHCKSKHHKPGIETIESKWVSYNEIMWDEIAFSSVKFALKQLHSSQVPHYGQYDPAQKG
jgi:ADP-ribose pyrophosphatase YjhB (NUDIX family)